ncbi:helix-turn-helix domain-containing protein [Paenibacillus thalictri]|uniref:AraC family transcriptional regulator n=1 Tax=Paenibacillus thalictri TaxID=2527873 RepID=A0A4Q9DHF9_9BACL|nr:helix-turn-helix domain-containing protein [Paenibacillus thalictri]TBL70303.1 AraC family transcriptional regulator [Paenibacillus thalictri]
MSIVKDIKNYPVYRRLLISYLLLVSIMVFLIGSVLYFYFSSSTTKEISEMMQSMLTQTSTTADNTNNQVYYVSNQLLNDNNVNNMLLSTEQDDPIRDYKAYLTLKNINSVYPFLKYIGVYNGKIDHYINTLGLPYDSDKDILQALKNGQVDRKFQMFSREVKNGNELYRVLTFVFYPNATFAKSTTSALIINLDEQYFRNVLQQYMNSPKGQIFVMNSQGSVISHSNPDLFNQSLANEPYVQHILQSSDNSGYFTQTVHREKQLVAYVKSAQLGWYFVSIRPYIEVIPQTNTLKNVTLVIAATMIMLGFALSFWITSNIYTPIRSLMWKLRHQMQSTQPFLKHNVLRQLMKEPWNDMQLSDNMLSDNSLQLDSPYYLIFLLHIDDVQRFEQVHPPKDQALIRFAICNIAAELLERHYAAPNPVVIENDEVGILAGTASAAMPDTVILTLKEIQEVIQQYFKITITVAIGDSVQKADHIASSYHSALKRSEYRFFYGHNSIIDGKMITQRATQHSFKYPAIIEKNLIEFIKLEDRSSVHGQIRKFMKSIESTEYFHALTYSHQLLLSILKEFEGTVIHVSSDSSYYYERLAYLSKLETLDAIEKELLDYCDRICDLLEQKQNLRMSDNLEKVKDYLEEHYHDPNLSLELAAEAIHISPGYLRKQFKTYYAVSFHDMLKNLRLDKACALLIETDESMAVISESIGMLNTNYFYTLFKKRYGISPAQYREQKRADLR